MLVMVEDVITKIKQYIQQEEPNDEVGEELQVKMNELKVLIQKMKIHSPLMFSEAGSHT